MCNPLEPKQTKLLKVRAGFVAEGFKPLEDFGWFKPELIEEVATSPCKVRRSKTELQVATISFGEHQLYALVPRDWTKIFIKALKQKHVEKAFDCFVNSLSFKNRIFWQGSKTFKLLKHALMNAVESEIAALLSGDKTEGCDTYAIHAVS
jgi:hypothetical protein